MTPLCPRPIRSAHLSAEILPKGATLSGLKMRASGRDLILGFADPQDHSAYPGCLGAVVGPVANRIRNGRVTLGGHRHQMPCNEGGQTALHSGPEGLDVLDWTVVAQMENALTLAIDLPDGAQGLPGQRRIQIRYHLEGWTLEVTIEASTDKTTAMNPAWHPYWTLGAPDVSALQLQITAETYLPVDTQNLPTGVQAPVAGGLFDFRSPKPVPKSPMLDTNYCLADAPRQEPRHALTLSSSDGTRLDLSTTAPGLQVYAGAHLPPAPDRLHQGATLAPYGGMALEPQFWPDAPNQPSFPQITLHPGQSWRQISRYHITPAHGQA